MRRKEEDQSLPQKDGKELERGGWRSAWADCGFFGVCFFLVVKFAPPLRIFSFFLSFIHELLTVLFSKSVYPNDLSLL